MYESYTGATHKAGRGHRDIKCFLFDPKICMCLVNHSGVSQFNVYSTSP